jgi:superfamily II DNA/RNA helicase
MVDHAFYPVNSDQKEDLLHAIMRRERPSKCLIFCATREGTAELASKLRRRGFDVLSISSLLSQANRERALEAFRTGASPVLVATDVAARGLDITDIDLVINFDVPMTGEEYVHRIGRTGRAERTGKAVTLVSELDGRRVAEIRTVLKQDVPEVRLEGFAYDEPRKPRGAGRGRGRGGPGGGGAGRGRSSSGSGGGRRRRSGGGGGGSGRSRGGSGGRSRAGARGGGKGGGGGSTNG